MKINNYITLDTENVYNNKEFRLYYTGYLAQIADDNPVFIQYGDQDWKNIRNVKMKKDKDNRLYANIKLNNFDTMNFCFNYDNIWDNNFSNDYSFQLAEVNLENYQSNENELEEVLSDEFLVKYNLNTKNAVNIPYVTAESAIYENASNASLSEVELENIKEALDKLFPKEETEKIAVNNIEASFAKSFAANDFIAIEVESDELEVFTPAMPYRQLFIEKIQSQESEYITNIVLEDSKIVLRSNIQYADILREKARRNELQQILSLGSEEEAQFLVVSPYSKIDIYDDSVLGKIKRYAAYATQSIKKVYFYLKESLSMEDI